MNKTTIILLTACVKPNGMSFTALQDMEVRQNQYEEALLFYLKNTDLNILFVENTNTNFSEKFIDYIDNKRLQYITFNGNDYDKELGKGYGEALIIQEAVNTDFYKNADFIIKISGRTILRNIDDLIKQDKQLKNYNSIIGDYNLKSK